MIDVTVVIANYNRPDALLRLLGQLDEQTHPRERFEIVVVDDGSREPVAPRVDAIRDSLHVTVRVERQANGGAAAARNRGASLATGDIILFIDDDMQVPRELVAAHWREHERNTNALVLGVIRRDEAMPLTLFERFHVRVLERLAVDVREGRASLKGTNVYTGNLSVRRAEFARTGGFDVSLGHSEDAEFGVRLEKDGAKILLSEEGYSVHSSDHTSLDGWMRRAYKYGVFDSRIAAKHPDVRHANPWRYLGEVSWLTRPFMVGALAIPKVAHVAAVGAMQVALASDAIGLERLALAGSTFVFGIEYARGMRDAHGGLRPALGAWFSFATHAPRSRS